MGKVPPNDFESGAFNHSATLPGGVPRGQRGIAAAYIACPPPSRKPILKWEIGLFQLLR